MEMIPAEPSHLITTLGENLAVPESYLRNILGIGRIVMILGEPMPLLSHGSLASMSRVLSSNENPADHHHAQVLLSDKNRPLFQSFIKIAKHAPPPPKVGYTVSINHFEIAYQPSGLVSLSVNRFCLPDEANQLEDPDFSLRGQQDGWDDEGIRRYYDDRACTWNVSGPPQSLGPNTRNLLGRFSGESLTAFKDHAKLVLEEILDL